MPDQSRSDSPAGAVPSSAWRRFVWRWAKRVGITVVVLVLLSASLLGVAEHRTSQPQFCGSCHIMEPYYETWHADPHGGKLGIACVECHYAPGERDTITAKLRGLSQVASYVSGRYGTSRPRAHVDNRSCLTSKCHGDLAFMDKVIPVGTVNFTHANHLRQQEAKREATAREVETSTQALRQLLGQERFEKAQEVAQQALPMKARNDQLVKLVEKWPVKIEPQQLLTFTELQDRQVRVAQLADLQCTSCHSYVAPDLKAKALPASAHHFTVKTTSCYTCHFTNENFNTGTGRCLLCHTLPTKEIMVHQELSPQMGKQLDAPELAKQPVKMNHQTILERKVDCIACHADVATENSMVTRRDCERCHDRPEYFARWKEPPSLELVKTYHAAHVPDQRAKCLDCHSEIHHQLVRGQTDKGQPKFLSSVMADCTHCHPNQHLAQIELLTGAGGKGIAKADPNLMFGSRTNCFGCHTKETATEHGGRVLRGALSGCVACHGERQAQALEKWKKTLAVLIADAESAYQNAHQSLDKNKGISPETRQKVEGLLEAAHSDLNLVKYGNGVHNFMYSMDLLDSVTQRCQQAAGLVRKESQPNKP